MAHKPLTKQFNHATIGVKQTWDQAKNILNKKRMIIQEYSQPFQL